MSDINQVLWGRSIDLLTSTTVFNDGYGVSIDNRVINVVFELLQQFQQARKEGWEQCKREASHICRDGIPTSWGFTSSQELSDAINTMEYKEVV